MRYTRYNNNQGNNNRRRGGRNHFFLIGLVICIPLAIGIGMIFGPMIFKPDGGTEAEGTSKKPPVTQEGGSTEKEKPKDNTTNAGEAKEPETPVKGEEGKTEEFYILQCGVYGKEENAQKVLEDIPKEFNGFVAKDSDKFRVVAGIYDGEDSKQKSEVLTNSKIENVRIKSLVPVEDENGIKVAKITKAYIDILKKFDNPETKSVNTNEFKKWTNELKSEKETEENEEVKNLKEHVNKLPENLERKDSKNSMEILYNILNKHRV